LAFIIDKTRGIVVKLWIKEKIYLRWIFTKELFFVRCQFDILFAEARVLEIPPFAVELELLLLLMH